MKVLIPGHKYQLDMMEGGYLIVQFIQKEEKDGKFVTVHNGTTNEEVLEMLIDRIMFLDQKLPSENNMRALERLITALHYLRQRTQERKERGVEGTPKP